MPSTHLTASADRATADAGRRLHELILEETDFAVPEPDARARSLLQLGTRRRNAFYRLGETVDLSATASGLS